jgi:hypothetical protein
MMAIFLDKSSLRVLIRAQSEKNGDYVSLLFRIVLNFNFVKKSRASYIPRT